MSWPNAGPGRPPGSTDSPTSPRGARTKARLEAAQNFARLVTENEEYRQNLLARAIKGTLAPQVETALLYYAYGKPAEHVVVKDNTPQLDPSKMTEEEIRRRAERISRLATAIVSTATRDEPSPDPTPLAPEPKSVS